MTNIQVYKYEREDGLAEMLASQAKASTVCVNITEETFQAKADHYYDDEQEKKIHKSFMTNDLMAVHGLLVTTNWNRNDDVFSPDQVWPARRTPFYKPANVGHMGQETDKENKIIGVITECYPVQDNDDYSILTDEEFNQNPNVKFHLLIGIYVWEKYWPTISKELRDKISKQKMYISMECLFTDFGYALREAGSENVILIDRDESTAWLTKFLRAYKGTGKIKLNGKEYLIGRWIKKPIFSGVGFVEQPGNPESIVFQDFISYAHNTNIVESKAMSEYLNTQKFDILSANCVLNINRGNIALWPN